MNAYIDRILRETRDKNPNEPEFLQAVEEVLTSVEPLFDAHPEYEKASLLERIVEPERTFSFRVTWMDDNGKYHVNRGYRVQYNAALGPYKGGLRFAPNVNLSIMKALGFEQTFKDALTGLPIGGAKGGSDFDPRNCSDTEIMRFCEAFMTEMYRHIGIDTDCPAGDIGVGSREIGYLYGQYRRIKGMAEFGVVTGKAVTNGGSLLRPEATGYGAFYYLEEVLKHEGETLEGKRIAVSGFGNVAWGIMKKAAESGAKVTYFAGPDGYIHDPDGIITEDKLNFILKMRADDPMHCKPYADKFGVSFVPNEKCWGVKDVDIYMPAAIQNDVDMKEAKKIASSGVRFYIEVANMPTTNDALTYLKSQKHMVIAPAKAVNACGVSVSALEMAQNAGHIYWTEEVIDAKMREIMKHIYDISVKTSEKYGLGYDLCAGANLAGFERVAEAMIAEGIF